MRTMTDADVARSRLRETPCDEDDPDFDLFVYSCLKSFLALRRDGLDTEARRLAALDRRTISWDATISALDEARAAPAMADAALARAARR